MASQLDDLLLASYLLCCVMLEVVDHTMSKAANCKHNPPAHLADSHGKHNGESHELRIIYELGIHNCPGGEISKTA